KKFVVPQTGRYFVVVHPTAPFDGTLRRKTHVAADPKWTGTAHVDPASAPSEIAISAPPGAKLAVVVKRAKGGVAAPTITSVKDGAGNELLVASELKVHKTSATLAVHAPLGGGDYTIAFASVAGAAAGDVVWTASLKLPKTYGFTLPDEPSG